MILSTSATQTVAATSNGWSFGGLVREMLNSWLSHHQRLADLGVSGDL